MLGVAVDLKVRADAVRVGYASCGEEDVVLPRQIRALEAAGCARIFFEQADAVVKARPERDAALDSALQTARDAGRGRRAVRVALCAVELQWLVRDAQDFIELAGRLGEAGVGLELLGGPLAGLHEPDEDGLTLFSVLAAADEMDRALAAARIRAGQRAAEVEGRRSGRPRVLDDALLAEAVRLRDAGVPVPQIAEQLVIASGRQAGRHPSIASVYRALSEGGRQR
jgi:DNA invertase Pin-like site-specific DNA recombinase